MAEAHALLIGIGAIYFIYTVICIFWMIKPPKNINRTYGYRTPGSMKTLERWKYANKLAPRLMIAIVHIALLLTGIIFYVSLKLRLNSISAFVFSSLLFAFLPVLSIPIVEYRLKKHFSENKIKLR